MKVGFITDYYPPFNPGGSEWSVNYLGQELKKENIEVVVITPNYGASNFEVINNLDVFRFPSFKTLKNNRSVINPIWQDNPIFFLWSGWFIYKLIKNQKIDIIHVHGKFTIPGSLLA